MIGDGPVEVAADQPLPAELAAGDIVHAGTIAVEVPQPGETVTITVEDDHGGSAELSISNPLVGRVAIVTRAPETGPVVIAAGATGACQDGAYNLQGHRWTSPYQWRFQAGSTPSANSKDNVEAGLIRAANSITLSRNDCGLADQVSATHQYLGRTTTPPNIASRDGTVTCGARDSLNTVGFGGLPTGVLGVACSWTDGTGTALEGDVRLTTRYAWYAEGVPAGCSNRYGVQPVATHELGHVFGLAHVSESTHPNLTMSTATAPCTNAGYTLGLGDVRALRQLY